MFDTSNPVLQFAQALRGTTRDGELPRAQVRKVFADLTALAETLPAEEIHRLLAGIASILLKVATREDARRQASIESIDDRHEGADNLLDVAEAAQRMGVKERWLYTHHKELPFSRKLGPKTLRFSERGLERWLSKRTQSAA